MASWKIHKYYRGVVLVMLTDRLNDLMSLPYLLTTLDVHSIIKQITKTKSTANFNDSEFNYFLEKVWCIGSHIGVNIPDPNEEVKTWEAIPEHYITNHDNSTIK